MHESKSKKHGFHALGLTRQGKRPGEEKEKQGKRAHNQGWGYLSEYIKKGEWSTDMIRVIRKIVLEGVIREII